MLEMKLTLDGILTIIVGLGAIIVAYKQLKSGVDMQKATFFKELYSTFFNNPDIKAAFYLIEYRDLKYDETFHGSKKEKQIDILLGFVSTVCEFHDKKYISDKDMRFFEYRFKRIYQNEELSNYLNNLDMIYKSNNIKKLPFEAFRNYCEFNITRGNQ